MDNLMGNKEWYEGLDKEVIGELVNKYQSDEGYVDLATEIDDEELLDDEVELVQSLKEKHAINHKKAQHIKRKKLRELKNKGVEGYEDNPDKYFHKKTKKTKAIRQHEKELRNKRERRKELKLKQII